MVCFIPDELGSGIAPCQRCLVISRVDSVDWVTKRKGFATVYGAFSARLDDSAASNWQRPLPGKGKEER